MYSSEFQATLAHLTLTPTERHIGRPGNAWRFHIGKEGCHDLWSQWQEDWRKSLHADSPRREEANKLFYMKS